MLRIKNMKIYYVAHIVLKLKLWHSPIKYFWRRAYIDPFYKGQIKGEIIKLGVDHE